MATLQQPQQPYNLFGPQMFEHQGKQAQYQPNTVINQSSTDTSQPNTNTATANNSTPQEAQFKLERDHQGNYYTNGVKTPMHVFNPDAVPYIKDEQQQNNKPITSMEELARAMGYTSPEDERKMRRASLMNQRILAVGDALRHIGNIANTVGYAPAQQFNNPVLEEEARYEKGKAMRDRANQQYIAYQQAKAKQDAEQKRWEAQFDLQQANAEALNAYRKEQARIAEQKAANEKEYRAADLARKIKADEEAAKHRNKMAGIAGMNAQTGRMRANAYIKYLQEKGTGNGGKSPYDYATPNGKITMGRNFSQTQKDQVIAKFRNYTNESEIKRQMRELGMNTNDPAQVRNFQFAQILLEHQDVADFVSQKFGGKQTFDTNPLARPEQHGARTLFPTAWSQSNNAPSIGWDDNDDEDIHDNDDDNLIGW